MLDSSPSTSPSPVEPNILIPKTIGLMNVMFAITLMACGMCYSVYSVLLPGMGPMLKGLQNKQREQKIAMNRADIDALKTQEAQAATEEEKAGIHARIESLSFVPPPPVVDFGLNYFGFDEPRVLGYFVVDAASGLILNLVLFVAGIGLLRRGEWGRKLGLFTAWSKLIRLASLTAFLILVTRPVMLSHARDSFPTLAKAEAQAPGMSPEDARTLIQGVDRFTITFGLMILLVGSIYPILSIALLSRPSARAACRFARKS